MRRPRRTQEIGRAGPVRRNGGRVTGFSRRVLDGELDTRENASRRGVVARQPTRRSAAPHAFTRSPPMTQTRRWTLALLGVSLGGCATVAPRPSGEATSQALRPRVVVTADPELDDSNSLVRYLLHATDFRTEGLVYASSQFHWKGDGKGTTLTRPNREYNRSGPDLCPCTSWRWAPDERFIDDAVETYAKVYPNLRVHDPSYPTPAELESKIRWGNVDFDGEMERDTPGSDLIKSLLLDDEPGPLYLLAWGGQSTIARALKSIEEQYQGTPQWPAIREKVSRKAILSTSGDQDDTGAHYITPHWPEIRTLRAGAGGVPLAYGASLAASDENAVYYSVDWTRDNVSSRGPFGAFYRVWGDGKQMVKGDVMDYFGIAGQTADELRAKGYVVWLPPRPKGEFLGEGDTFTYLNLVANGLTGWEDATPGGWGGHGLENGVPRAPRAGGMSLAGLGTRSGARPPSPEPNFVPAAQNELAARIRWSVTPTYAGANHAPRVTLRTSAHVAARPGETVRLEGAASDPDGNAVRVRWWQWQDVDTYPGRVTIANPTALAASFQVPNDAAAGQTIHLVLEATDDGRPAMTRYRRVVVTVAR
jgi:hypothetical protein